jgi:galactose mutarotase-like enzyme
MTVIENDFLKVTIDAKGAQLSSVIDKKENRELMWQADPNVWPWHAPNLFPIVGGVINDELLVDGKAYAMKRHGFARHSEFVLINSDDQSAVFSLPNSERTHEVYPYSFDFEVMYLLIDNALRITYKVINRDKRTIYFSVGGHPAFNLPFYPNEQYEDYYLEFEVEEKLERYLLAADGMFSGGTEPVQFDGKKLWLKKDMFNDDALVFKNLRTREVTIKSKNHNQSLTVEFPHFNYLGIWAKSGAPFVCVEPWLGCTDTEGQPKDISQKENIQKLAMGHVFEAAFFISI